MGQETNAQGAGAHGVQQETGAAAGIEITPSDDAICIADAILGGFGAIAESLDKLTAALVALNSPDDGYGDPQEQTNYLDGTPRT